MVDDALPAAVRALQLLADMDAENRQRGEGIALTRLAKRLDMPVSVLMRELAPLGHARLGAAAGPGWVRVEADAGGRWLAWITEAGRAALAVPDPAPVVGEAAGAVRVLARTWHAAGGQAAPERSEWVADERPLALEYNGVSHAVMLGTPLDLDDFALGFSITEGLIDDPADLLDLEIDERPDGVVLNLRITARCEMRLKERQRNLAGRTGCGLCGTASLDQVRRPGLARVQPRPLDMAALDNAMRAMGPAQALQALTGGVHAAAWCQADGALLLLREDVGRHNALDKLVGAMRRQRVDPSSGFIAVTSRASFEMVQKAVVAGVGLLATVSAPSGLAVRLADELGLTLVGFVREGRATVYRPQALPAPAAPMACKA